MAPARLFPVTTYSPRPWIGRVGSRVGSRLGSGGMLGNSPVPVGVGPEWECAPGSSGLGSRGPGPPGGAPGVAGGRAERAGDDGRGTGAPADVGGGMLGAVALTNRCL